MPVNHVINVDWLAANILAKDLNIFGQSIVSETSEKKGKALRKERFQGVDKYSFGKTTFKRTGNGNRFYSDTYTVWNSGKKYGNMLANSRDKNLLPLNNYQFQVNNNKLYEVGWLDTMQEIFHHCKFQYKSFVRLDIAIDGGSYFHIWEKCLNKELEKVGRAKIKAYYDGKIKQEGFEVGASHSKKRVIVYDKSAELKKKNKWYIEKFWKRSDLLIDGRVERVELRIKNEEGRKFKDIDYTKFDDIEHLASIMQANCNKFFEFVYPSSDKNISRKKRYEAIDWDSIGAQYLDKDSTRPTNALWAGKITCKYLFEIFVITKQKHFLHTAYEIAHNLDALRWFNERQPEWEKELNHRVAAIEKGKALDNWVTNFKAYNQGEQVLIYDEQELRKMTY